MSVSQIKTNYYPSGQIKSQGSVVAKKKEGKWTEYFPGGEIKTMMHYKAGKLNGDYMAWNKAGVLEVMGEYENGLKNGIWTYHAKNGYLAETKTFVNDLLHGDVVLYNTEVSGQMRGLHIYVNNNCQKSYQFFPDGRTLEEINYKGDSPLFECHGLHTRYYPNGAIYQTCVYADGKKHGLQITYSENGDVIERLTFHKGNNVK